MPVAELRALLARLPADLPVGVSGADAGEGGTVYPAAVAVGRSVWIVPEHVAVCVLSAIRSADDDDCNDGAPERPRRRP